MINPNKSNNQSTISENPFSILSDSDSFDPELAKMAIAEAKNNNGEDDAPEYNLDRDIKNCMKPGYFVAAKGERSARLKNNAGNFILLSEYLDSTENFVKENYGTIKQFGKDEMGYIKNLTNMAIGCARVDLAQSVERKLEIANKFKLDYFRLKQITDDPFVDDDDTKKQLTKEFMSRISGKDFDIIETTTIFDDMDDFLSSTESQDINLESTTSKCDEYESRLRELFNSHDYDSDILEEIETTINSLDKAVNKLPINERNKYQVNEYRNYLEKLPIWLREIGKKIANIQIDEKPPVGVALIV